MGVAYNNFTGKKALIAGLGRSGKAALDALHGLGAVLSVFDDRDIEADEPGFFKKLMAIGAECFVGGAPVPDEAWDYVVLSPGVPPTLPFVERAKRRGAEAIGEVELSYRAGHGIYVAITGTNGKTTTTALAGEVFSDAGLKAAVCGNIGTPVSAVAMGADEGTWLVTEVSSFQLDTTRLFRPRIAALLNLTPDHMDRHGTMEAYAAAKARIFANQGEGDVLAYNADDALVAGLAAAAKCRRLPFSRTKELAEGVFVQDGWIVYRPASGPGPAIHDCRVCRAGELKIPGAHNLENALAAVAVASAAGIGPESMADTLRHFPGVGHRLEFAGEIDGVRFVNDSKGTNPDAAIKAIEAIEGGLLLIAGGYDKDADFTEYVRAAKGRARKLLLLGATAEKIRACAAQEGFSGSDIVMAGSMETAVRLGKEHARKGDTVLLSPACASWDMYKDYEERGAEFKALAHGLGAMT